MSVLIAILAAVGTAIILWNRRVRGTWKARFMFCIQAISLYLLIGVILSVIYVEVIWRWFGV